METGSWAGRGLSLVDGREMWEWMWGDPCFATRNKIFQPFWSGSFPSQLGWSRSTVRSSSWASGTVEAGCPGPLKPGLWGG